MRSRLNVRNAATIVNCPVVLYYYYFFFSSTFYLFSHLLFYLLTLCRLFCFVLFIYFITCIAHLLEFPLAGQIYFILSASQGNKINSFEVYITTCHMFNLFESNEQFELCLYKSLKNKLNLKPKPFYFENLNQKADNCKNRSLIFLSHQQQ